MMLPSSMWLGQEDKADAFRGIPEMQLDLPAELPAKVPGEIVETTLDDRS